MERTSKVLTINCAQSLIWKICTKQNQQMNKTMKVDGGNGNYMDLNFIVARHCLFTNAFKLLLFSFSFFFSEVCRRLSYLSAYFTQKIKETERERCLIQHLSPICFCLKKLEGCPKKNRFLKSREREILDF